MSGSSVFVIELLSMASPAMVFLLRLPFVHVILLVCVPNEENDLLFQGGYENEEEILDRDPYRRAAAESSAGSDAIGGGGRYVIDGD